MSWRQSESGLALRHRRMPYLSTLTLPPPPPCFRAAPARAAHGHVPVEPQGSQHSAPLDRRGGGACFRRAVRGAVGLRAADTDQRLDLWAAGAQPDTRRGDRRTDFARPRGTAVDRRLCVGAAIGESGLVAGRDDSACRAHHRGDRHASGVSVVPAARPLRVDCDAG